MLRKDSNPRAASRPPPPIRQTHRLQDRDLAGIFDAGRIRSRSRSPPPAIVFFHIPLRQFHDIVNAGAAAGFKAEDVCYADDDGSALGVFAASGMVRELICGHERVNDYYGDIEGVRLRYGRASGYGGYGREHLRRGGSLIRLDLEHNDHGVTTVFADGSSWVPAGFTDRTEELRGQ